MKNISDKIDPSLVVLSGDITDSSAGSSFFQIYSSNYQNWVLYNNSRYESGLVKEGRVLLEYPGNHDYFKVAGDDTPLNYYKKFAFHNELSETGTIFSINTSIGPINFISFAVLHPPLPTTPFGSLPQVHPDDVDLLRRSIYDNGTNIIVSHFPVSTIWERSAPNGESLRSVITRSHLYIAGHTHPRSIDVQHVNDTLSVICPISRRYTHAGFITIEKNAIAYSEITPADENIIAVTYPTPLNQVHKHQVFNVNSFPVRVLGFSSSVLTLDLYIDNVLIGNIPMTRQINNRTRLYSLNVTVENGRHNLRIEGDSTKEFEFFVGETSPVITEKISLNFGIVIFPFSMIFLAIAFVRIIPYWIPLKSKLDNFSDFMFYSEGEYTIFQQFYLGLLHFWTRPRKLPLHLYLLFIFLFCWIYIIPYIETQVEHLVAVIWIWGYKAGDCLSFDTMTFAVLMFYYLMFFIQFLNIAGIWFESQKLCISQIIEFVISWICVFIVTVAWFVIGYFHGGAFSIFTSVFTYFLIITYVWVIVTLVRSRNIKIGGKEEMP
ncbi:Ser/Thr protein phosphatase [Histomonas meleagridis]|uniref:Ser/Thr protein phosphatase n=1 Tax=Histomonas meleagridis TaxID=135588 RepID=UPI00355A6DAA|nr:Ser/Thr protein phosphatase [Histomonas meleagridis]KAH0800115.1 Ser/Thr protein phosphatase [Histomonas meleagridis]